MNAATFFKKYALPLKLLSSIIVPFIFIVAVEQLTRLAIQLGWIQYQPPMITQLPPGTEDWRRAHMTADKLRQPDPLLWWRPRDGSPYNEQGFKGPLAEIPKSANTVRILVYGDSNTEGTPEDSWPAKLQLVLKNHENQTGRKYEVLNAGVAGYSSHQGLLRFQQEVEKYTPDIVLVAFGWNDLARGIQPDRSYRPSSGLVVALERMTLKLRTYWTLKQWLLSRSDDQATRTVPRVPIEDYKQNLSRFASLAKQHKAVAVFITRPHRDPVETLRSSPLSYSAAVPEYNQALLSLAREQNVPSVDAEKHFLDLAEKKFWGDECHFTELGRIEMAELIFQHLKRSGLL